MLRRIFVLFLLLPVLCLPVRAEPIKWVDFSVDYPALKYALEHPTVQGMKDIADQTEAFIRAEV